MKRLLFLLLLTPILWAMQCDEKLVDPNPACPEQVVVSESDYKNAPADELTVIDAFILNDCLTIEFAASGCDGSAWEVKLIDANVVMESYPVQRNIRLSLRNQEECDAVITKTVAFDISPLQLEYDKILLNLTNSGAQLLYEY